MAVSLRLTKAEDQRRSSARRSAHGISKSAYLRQCLAERLKTEKAQPSAYELGKDFIRRRSERRHRFSGKC